MKELDFEEKDTQLAAGAIVGGSATLATATTIGPALTTLSSAAAIPTAGQIGIAIATFSPIVAPVAIGLGALYLLSKIFD
jgi:hypothetical protein